MISLIIHIRITLKLEKVFSFGHSDVFAMDYIPLKKLIQSFGKNKVLVCIGIGLK
jgi:hypothetical protein